MPTKQVQVSLTFDEIEAIDAIAEARARSRSWVIAGFIKEGLEWAPIRSRGELIGRMDASNGSIVASVKASGLQVGE